MAQVKTAISLPEPLFEQMEALARETNLSRSRLVALALEAFIQRHENQRLLARLNAAYEAAPDATERAVQQAHRRRHCAVVEGEW